MCRIIDCVYILRYDQSKENRDKLLSIKAKYNKNYLKPIFETFNTVYSLLHPNDLLYMFNIFYTEIGTHGENKDYTFDIVYKWIVNKITNLNCDNLMYSQHGIHYNYFYYRLLIAMGKYNKAIHYLCHHREINKHNISFIKHITLDILDIINILECHRYNNYIDGLYLFVRQGVKSYDLLNFYIKHYIHKNNLHEDDVDVLKYLIFHGSNFKFPNYIKRDNCPRCSGNENCEYCIKRKKHYYNIRDIVNDLYVQHIKYVKIINNVLLDKLHEKYILNNVYKYLFF